MASEYQAVILRCVRCGLKQLLAGGGLGSWAGRLRHGSLRAAGAVGLLLYSSFAGAADGAVVRSLLEIRQERVIIQEWDLSCGSAALATLLNYQQGDAVTEKQVAIGLMGRAEYIENPMLVHVRQGFSLLDLKRYVESRGYKGIGYGKLELEDLVKRAPVIVPVNTVGYNHFVIFQGVRGNRVLLADPAWGNRTMTVERFMRSWIIYPEIDRVGFVAQRRDGMEPPNQLVPRSGDFVMLR